MLENIIRISNKLIDSFILIIILIIVSYLLYTIYDYNLILEKSELNDEILYLKPINNTNKIENLKKIDENIFGWIHLNNTAIDYPIVQGKDNSEYLRKNYNNEYSISGAIFLDYRNDIQLNNFYNIIYGHHMGKQKMFGDLDKYKNQDFFYQNQTGYLYLSNKIYNLNIFACAVVSLYDSDIFSLEKNNMKKNIDEKTEFMQLIKRKSINYIENIKIEDDSKIIALSTCAKDITNGRLVVFAKAFKK